MDLNDVWTQNKRWILGVLAGVVLFWIGSSIVQTIYDANGAEAKVGRIVNAMRKQSYLDRKARKDARAAGEQLEAMEARLREELVFVPEERFTLAGKGDPDLHFDQVAREVQSSLVDKAQQYGVDMPATALEWKAPVGREEIERALIGMNILETGIQRLLDAGEEVRTNAEFGALGVQAIEKFEIDAKRSSSRSRGRRRSRRASAGADVTDRVDEYQVSFKFRADAPTVQVFLEKCRALEPSLLLQNGFKMKSGRNPGDPLQVTGQLLGIIVRDPES